MFSALKVPMDVQIQAVYICYPNGQYETLGSCRSLRFQYLEQPKLEKVQFVHCTYHGVAKMGQYLKLYKGVRQGSVSLKFQYNIWINQNWRKSNLSIVRTMGGKDGPISQIAQGCPTGFCRS